MAEVVLKWHGPWCDAVGPEVGGSVRLHQPELGSPGVYIWIWKGNPDRPFYVGKAGERTGANTLWARLTQHHAVRFSGGYNQYRVPEGDDLFAWYAKNYNTPDFLLGANPKEMPLPATDPRLVLARASFGRMAFAFATFDQILGFVNPSRVEAQLREDLKRHFESVTGCSLPKKALQLLFGYGAAPTNTLPELQLKHQDFSDADVARLLPVTTV